MFVTFFIVRMTSSQGLSFDLLIRWWICLGLFLREQSEETTSSQSSNKLFSRTLKAVQYIQEKDPTFPLLHSLLVYIKKARREDV